MAAVRVLVASREDPASLNMRDRLKEAADWQEAGEFRGAPILRRHDSALVEIEGPSVRDEALSGALRAAFGRIDAVWFLGRHRAASGHPSLTVHPIGNHGAADYGGRVRTLSPAASRDMSALLRALRARHDAADLPHAVTFEATHHGPLTDIPALFLEIGSDDGWYRDRMSAQTVAAAAVAVMDGQHAIDASVVVGVGGGHYVPRHSDLALTGRFDFGHFVPAYALDPEGDAAGVLSRAFKATPGAAGVYVHKKGLKGPQREAVRRWLDETGVEALSSA